MQNGNIKLKELFNGDKIFNIPKYQRTYAWKDENLEYFLEDLLNQRGEKSYFLGTLLFHQKKDRGEYEFIDVVDGQQRLTTIMIFMQSIITILQSKNSKKVTKKTFSKYIYDGENYKLELENEDNSFMQNAIFNDKKINSLETPSQKRLMEAKKYFKLELAKYDTERLEELMDILINSDVILYIVDKISDATQIFELLNDRGRKLTNLESIKSFLMYKIGCLDLKDDGEQSISNIQDNFSAIYRLIEKNSIDEGDLLRFHTIAFEKSKNNDYNNPVRFLKTKINNLFNDKKDSRIKKELLGYVDRLKNSFSIYEEIKTNKQNSVKMDDLVMIGRVNPFYPLLMNIYHNDKEKLDNFISDLVKFTFRATLLSLRNDNEGFYTYIRKDEDFSEIFKTVINNNWWNINNRVSEVLEYRNFYEWVNKNIVKYILFSYENSLRAIKGYPNLTIENYFSSNKREKLSIEHITAQKTKSLAFNDDFKENYLHSLGNLVIDTVSSNSRKGNKGIDDKISEFVQAPLMSQNEIQEVKVNWTDINDVKAYIDLRNEKIIKFIKNDLM